MRLTRSSWTAYWFDQRGRRPKGSSGPGGLFRLASSGNATISDGPVDCWRHVTRTPTRELAGRSGVCPQPAQHLLESLHLASGSLDAAVASGILYGVCLCCIYHPSEGQMVD